MDLLGAATLFLAISLASLLLLSSWQQMHRRGKMPPGPTPLPLIGNLLWIDRNNLPNSLIKLSEKYGPVFTIQLGPRRIVVLCGYEAIKEALVDQGDEFRDRGKQGTFDRIFQGHGVAFSNGKKPIHLRRFSITTLRNFGVGKRSIEERILEEAHFLLEALRGTKGAPFDPTYFLSRSVSNVISSIAFGNRFDYEDQEFLSLLTAVTEVFRFSSSAQGQALPTPIPPQLHLPGTSSTGKSLLPPFSNWQLLDIFFGIMQRLPGSQQKILKRFSELKEFVAKKAKAHQETLDPNSPRDFIDCFLVKMLQEQKTPDSFFSMEELVATTLNIFFGGTETVSTTLRYGFLILLKYPEVEEKIHEEIDRVIGVNRTPSMEDRLQMPYTEAVIHEIQRFGDILPLALPRRVTQDVQLRGYTIPKGTEIFPMLGTAMRDPKHFARPEEFDPQHFLDEKGQFKKKEAFIPFCIGKRYCFGEHLARAELFLFLTSILQHFRFKSAVPPEDIDLSPMLVGFGTIPQIYEISVVPR
ncbi:cytochrome P450 2A13-like [Vipera latastei]